MLAKRLSAIVCLLGLLLALFGPVTQASPASHSIVINLPAYRLHHYIAGSRVGTYEISIGSIRTPTPVSSETRSFEIFQMVKNPTWRNPLTRQLVPTGPRNPLGTRWLGLLKIDRVVLTGRETWESLARQYRTTVSEIFRANSFAPGTRVGAGKAVLVPYHNGYGIHGTNVPDSIGTAVSLGCMRMRNGDIERLFASLPRGRRIPVSILYEPLWERVDPITGEVYVEIFSDIYRRVPDWSLALRSAADKVGAPLNRWQEDMLRQPFSGSHILSRLPGINNNNSLLAVGALNLDGHYFVPWQVVEQILGLSFERRGEEFFLGDRRLSQAEVHWSESGVYLAARLVGEVTGRAYFYDAFRHAVDFSVTRLYVAQSLIGFNRVLLHAELGPMVDIWEVAQTFALPIATMEKNRVRVANTELTGLEFGRQLFVCLREMGKLPLIVKWDAVSGVITIDLK